MGKNGLVTTCDIPPAHRQATQAFPINRVHVVGAFAALPDEAFQFVCGQIYGMSRTAGGFQPDSRSALEALGEMALSFVEAGA